MAWNLNNKKNEYQLSGSLTTELINMFGIEATYLKTQNMQVDEVLGDVKFYSVTTCLLYTSDAADDNRLV